MYRYYKHSFLFIILRIVTIILISTIALTCCGNMQQASYAHTCTYMHIHVHTYTYMYIHTHTCTYIHIHVHICTYMHIHVHAHTCTVHSAITQNSQRSMYMYSNVYILYYCYETQWQEKMLLLMN